MSNEWKKQQNIQAATSSLSAPQLRLRGACGWDVPRARKIKVSFQHNGSISLEVLDVIRKRRGNPDPCGEEEESSRLMLTLHPEAWRGNGSNEDPPSSSRSNLTSGFQWIILGNFLPVCWNMCGQLNNSATVRVYAQPVVWRPRTLAAKKINKPAGMFGIPTSHIYKSSRAAGDLSSIRKDLFSAACTDESRFCTPVESSVAWGGQNGNPPGRSQSSRGS